MACVARVAGGADTTPRSDDALLARSQSSDWRKSDALHPNRQFTACDSRSRRLGLRDGPGPGKPPSFAASQKANAQALRQYTWKSRTELKLKGESKNVKLEQVRYDRTASFRRRLLEARRRPRRRRQQGGRGGRGGRLKEKVIENKKEEFGDMMQGLGQLVASYGQLPPDKLQAFEATATNGRGEGAMQGTAQIQGLNVLEQGDSMTIWIDPASQMMRRVEIKTIYDEKPATLVADYRSVPNGPTYMARAVLTYPEKNVELTVDNSDYVPSQP